MKNPKTSTPALLAVLLVVLTGAMIITKVLNVDQALSYATGLGLLLTAWGLFKAKDGGV